MPKITELSLQEMRRTTGGDWFEITWGILVGTAFVAGVVGFLPVLAVTVTATAVALVLIPVK